MIQWTNYLKVSASIGQTIAVHGERFVPIDSIFISFVWKTTFFYYQSKKMVQKRVTLYLQIECRPLIINPNIFSYSKFKKKIENYMSKRSISCEWTIFFFIKNKGFSFFSSQSSYCLFTNILVIYTWKKLPLILIVKNTNQVNDSSENF